MEVFLGILIFLLFLIGLTICLSLDLLDLKHRKGVSELQRGFEVQPITGTAARVDTKEEDDHG